MSEKNTAYIERSINIMNKFRKIKEYFTLNELAKFYIEYAFYTKLFVRKEVLRNDKH